MAPFPPLPGRPGNVLTSPSDCGGSSQISAAAPAAEEADHSVSADGAPADAASDAGADGGSG